MINKAAEVWLPVTGETPTGDAAKGGIRLRHSKGSPTTVFTGCLSGYAQMRIFGFSSQAIDVIPGNLDTGSWIARKGVVGRVLVLGMRTAGNETVEQVFDAMSQCHCQH